MTAQELVRNIEERYISNRYDSDTHSLITNFVIPGIVQCLVNQEEIIKKLNKNVN